MEKVDRSEPLPFIKCTLFEKAFQRFRDIIIDGSLFYISNGIIVERDKNYLPVGEYPYEIRLRVKTFLTAALENSLIPIPRGVRSSESLIANLLNFEDKAFVTVSQLGTSYGIGFKGLLKAAAKIV